jgi:hypothetical protein
LNVAALSRDTGVPRHRLVTTLGPWFWRFVAVALAATAAGVWLQPSTFIVLAMTGAIAGGIYTLLVVSPLLQSPAGVYLRPLLAKGTAFVSALRPRKDGPELFRTS